MTQLSDSEAVRRDPPTADQTSAIDPSSGPLEASLLVMLASMPMEQQKVAIGVLKDSLPSTAFVVATPSETTLAPDLSSPVIHTPAINSSWPLSAADFVNAWEIAEARNLRAILILGPESSSQISSGLCHLASSVLNWNADLAIPYYDLPDHSGLVNSAILFPLTRALFASATRFPLAIDLGLSRRMAERLATIAKTKGGSLGDTLLWPVNEASVGGFTIRESDAGRRILPQPRETDFNSIFAQVIGSLFADIESKAAFWQRPRRAPTPRPLREHLPDTEGASDTVRMIEAFRLAHTNLQEIWSLVLSPHSLVGLKRLSVVAPNDFRMPEGLWSRVVYDFLIAYKLRAINRGHLFGALIPIYLAWVAGHINVILSGANAEYHIEAVAAAFEADRPYLVSRWRWPDRFNS